MICSLSKQILSVYSILQERGELDLQCSWLCESLHLGLLSSLLYMNEVALCIHVVMDYFLARLSSPLSLDFEKYVLAQEISRKAKVDLSVYYYEEEKNEAILPNKMELTLLMCLLIKRRQFAEPGNFLYVKFTAIAKIWTTLIIANLKLGSRRQLLVRFR